MANAQCMIPKCHKGYQSEDIDELEGFGRCPECKAKLRDIIIKTDNILAQRRRENPLPRERALDAFEAKQVPNSHGGFDTIYSPKILQ